MPLNIMDPYPAITRLELQQFENKLGFVLPADYKAFLLENNGGIPESELFWSEPRQQELEVSYFLGLDPTQTDANTEGFYDLNCAYEDLLFYNLQQGFLLPIAPDSEGNDYCLSLREQDYGQIYLWDQEDLPCTYDENDIPNGIDEAKLQQSLCFESFEALVKQRASIN